jgi:hypothetical protein
VNLNTVVSFYHTMAMKHCLEDGEIERELKCKIYDELCILGCFEECYKKARFSYITRGVEACVYISR